MSHINSWEELIKVVSVRKDNAFPKLLVKINKFLGISQKNNNVLSTVTKKQQDTFDNFKMMYQQLLLEDDITDIYVDIQSLDGNNSLFFNMVGIGKWIKFHSGNISRIFFIDDEKTMISDKTISDFFNKINIVRKGYSYFSKNPVIYYKFSTLPTNDIINYLKKHEINVLRLDQKTDIFPYPKEYNKVLLDQSIILTLCSNLSFGLSQSFYTSCTQNGFSICNESEVSDEIELMLKNKQNLDKFIEGKEIITHQTIFEQSKTKLFYNGGPTEKTRFNELEKHITIVPDCVNDRFKNMNEHEIVTLSVAEKEHAIILTGNLCFCNKINIQYKEISYKLFKGAQLVERKYN